MSTHKHIDKICVMALIFSMLLTVLWMGAGQSQIAASASARTSDYANRLFDPSLVHSIDIVIDDWEGFLQTCANEEYALCSVVIDNEAYQNVAIRAKGNSSLSQVSRSDSSRYSFKIEFDHYNDAGNYHGLDKLSLNNIIQDNTYMKDFLSYQMMSSLDVNAPLCSYADITVNGKDWGLYLAVESVEEAFLERNYGKNYGELYKPDNMDMGGGKGNGKNFDMENWKNRPDGAQMPEAQAKEQERPVGEATAGGAADVTDAEAADEPDGEPAAGGPDGGQMPGGPDGGQMPGGEGRMPPMANGGKSRMASADVSLLYTDDAYESYSNIFENAKTAVSNADKTRLIESLKKLNEGEEIEKVVNVDEVIRYFAVHNFLCNFDSYTGSMIHNYYLYEKNGMLSMIPWDYNLAFGGFGGGFRNAGGAGGADDATSLVNYPIDTPVSGGTVESRPMLSWIFQNEEYTQLYHEHLASFISSYFDSGYFSEMFDSVREMIAPYVEKDATKFCTFEEFQDGADALKHFCLLRAKSIDGQLDGTIPSTQEGQETDGASRIQADDLDMQAMGGAMQGGMGGMGRFNPADAESDMGEEKSEANSDERIPGAQPEPPGQPAESGTGAGTASNAEAQMATGISCAVLAAGLLAASLYKRV